MTDIDTLLDARDALSVAIRDPKNARFRHVLEHCRNLVSANVHFGLGDLPPPAGPKGQVMRAVS